MIVTTGLLNRSGVITEEASSEEEKTSAGDLCRGDADGVCGVYHAE